jgi:sporulation protein YlmC with PRC-barrel domain
MNKQKRKLRAIRKAAERRLVRLQDKMFKRKEARKAERLLSAVKVTIPMDMVRAALDATIIKKGKLKKQRRQLK